MIDTNLNTVRSDMSNLAKNAQDLYREANDATGEQASALRAKGAAVLETVIGKAKSAQATVVGTTKDIAGSTDSYVQGNPWKSIAISATIGVLAGVILGRR